MKLVYSIHHTPVFCWNQLNAILFITFHLFLCTVLVFAMEPPPWLFASFPRRPATEPFATLRRCVLRVDETGAGLDLEITDFGYQARNFK